MKKKKKKKKEPEYYDVSIHKIARAFSSQFFSEITEHREDYTGVSPSLFGRYAEYQVLKKALDSYTDYQTGFSVLFCLVGTCALTLSIIDSVQTQYSQPFLIQLAFNWTFTSE